MKIGPLTYEIRTCSHEIGQSLRVRVSVPKTGLENIINLLLTTNSSSVTVQTSLADADLEPRAAQTKASPIQQ